MRSNRWIRLAAGAVVLLASMGQAAAPDALTRARQAYNSRQFDAAIAAAREALREPSASNAAAVVLARAHLEKFRLAEAPADLDAARAALAQVRPDLLAPRDRQEFLVGVGVSLYVDGCTGGCFSAASEFFDQALAAMPSAEPAERDLVFEWWASALDRQAQSGPDAERVSIYARVLERAEAERARRADSATAAFWIAAAARGTGDYERAWGAAIAGWVQGKYLGARGATLRSDLDRLVTSVLLPERAKQLIPDADPRPMLGLLLKQWQEICEKYK